MAVPGGTGSEGDKDMSAVTHCPSSPGLNSISVEHTTAKDFLALASFTCLDFVDLGGARCWN
jgi:hypothetical protein